MRLLLIAEDARGLRQILPMLPRGGVGVQLRAKTIAAGPLLERARAIREICSEHGAPFLVNDRIDVALAAKADGVHLPANSVKPESVRALWSLSEEKLDAPIIGVSCHSREEVIAASKNGADYCVFGPVAEVPGKGPAQGFSALRDAALAAPIPIFALGGITSENAGAAIEAGARGIACIRFVYDSHDPAAAAIALWQAVT